MKGTRSGVTLQNLQEVVDGGGDLQKGLAQYLTPHSIAKQIADKIRFKLGRNPNTVIDPQAGEWGLLDGFVMAQKYGVEIQKSQIDRTYSNHIQGDCRKFGEILDDLFPETVWEVGVANFPFGLKWKPCQWTWDFLQRHTTIGCMIGPDNDEMRALAFNEHNEWQPGIWATERMEWPDADVTVRLVFYETDKDQTSRWDIKWDDLEQAMNEERKGIPPYNVWIKENYMTSSTNGTLGVYLSVRDHVKRKITSIEAQRLMRLNNATPQVLAVDRETRKILTELVEAGIYTIQPEARDAIIEAIEESVRVSTPIMPVTDFERVAYLDEEDQVVCVKDWGPFKQGHKYEVSSQVYTFQQDFTRRKQHYSEEYGAEIVEHECTLSGQDRKIIVRAEDHSIHFLANPDPNRKWEANESLLWEIFARPEVLTVADKFPEKVAENRRALETMELVGGMEFFSGQLNYLSRVLVRDNALIAAETGTGKSLMAIATYIVKDAKRCLIVCPKGTVDSEDSSDSDDLSQWVSEINRFAPQCEVFELFTIEDYNRILRLNGGRLPAGFYVTYYNAFFTNRAVENCSWKGTVPTWADIMLAEMVADDLTKEEKEALSKKSEWVRTLGEERNGIRCIAKPSLSTLVGHEFDMVCLDEAHNIKTLTANRTQAAIRLPAKYRFAFTATPVPNLASDIFPIMGWVCVDDWYRGATCNACWPFRREDFNRFEAIFLSKERDWTEERMITQRTGKSRKVEKKSPVLSSPARLLKILKPAIAYITKAQCNQDYLPPRIVDVRVGMGKDQAALYTHFTDRGNIVKTIARTPVPNAMVAASAQVEWLRAICTDPVYASMMGRPDVPKVDINFNPKVAAIMELTAECIKAGEQVVIVNSRKAITDTIHNLLEEAGVSVSRIDSSSRSGNHSEESNLFKLGNTRVMLMGIKCALGHSFDQCRNLIIGSLEYSPGPFEQARGRVDRLTSKESMIYCILCKNSIEEVMFDTVATKDDASKIILKGQRVPRDFKPVDMGEVLLDAIIAWDKQGEHVPEEDCYAKWDAIKARMK